MSRQQIWTPAILSLLVCASVLLPGCDDDPDTDALRKRLREVEAENRRLREDMERPADRSQQPDQQAEEPSPADSLTCGGAVAYLLAMMLQEYDLHPEKDIVKWVADTFEWPQIPNHLAEAGNATAAFTGPVAGHRLILAKGDIHGVFTIGAGEGFARDEFLSAVKEYCTIKIVQSSTEFVTLSEIAEVSTGGREIGVLGINSSQSQPTAGTGTVSFMPSSVARRILEGRQSP